MTKAVRVMVRGRVQGVAFRAFARDAALARGLRGWARNLADGSVEVAVAGPESDVARFLDHCRRGPDMARVEGIETAPIDDIDLPRPFEIRADAAGPDPAPGS